MKVLTKLYSKQYLETMIKKTEQTIDDYKHEKSRADYFLRIEESELSRYRKLLADQLDQKDTLS